MASWRKARTELTGAGIGSRFAPASSQVDGAVGVDVALSAGTPANAFSTASLGVGTWHVVAVATISCATGGAVSEVWLATDTATATLAGPVAAQIIHGSPGGATGTVTVSAHVTVTVAGTLRLVAQCNNAATVRAATTGTAARSGASGYTASRVA